MNKVTLFQFICVLLAVLFTIVAYRAHKRISKNNPQAVNKKPVLAIDGHLILVNNAISDEIRSILLKALNFLTIVVIVCVGEDENKIPLIRSEFEKGGLLAAMDESRLLVASCDESRVHMIRQVQPYLYIDSSAEYTATLSNFVKSAKFCKSPNELKATLESALKVFEQNENKKTK
eukprot:GDKJ01029149.1.p1 GENE.GDKJ01029149.1~~GDKJ01029149.1.p1  ORF type:complete len:176 (-),score=28.89 GDKJ01029149.1:23-550(-)